MIIAVLGWSLSVAGDGSAMLLHNGRYAGGGNCALGSPTDANHVSDQGDR
jgi:hypothetical protein